jgi:hypothetical protein
VVFSGFIRHEITEILLKLALSTISQTKLVWFSRQAGKKTPLKNIIIKDIFIMKFPAFICPTRFDQSLMISEMKEFKRSQKDKNPM